MSSLTARVLRRAAQSYQLGLGRHRRLSVGHGTFVHSTVRIEGRDIRVGRRCRLRRDVFLRGPEVRVGDNVFLNDGVYVNHHVVIEDDASIGQFTRLVTGSHELGPSGHRAGRTVTQPIRIGAGAWLGAGVTVLPGVTIGRGCVIASGAVVTADCAADGLYAGVPATLKKRLPS